MKIDGNFGFVAEIDPAPKGRLPWPGRFARWWFEVVRCNEEGEWEHLFEYDGGGITLRRCIWNASAALGHAEQEWMAANPLPGAASRGETP